jgi:polyhydroxyalkanoate synthesis regulator phasin
MTTARKKAETWRTALPKRMNKLQKTVEKRVQKGWEQVTEMLPPAQRKAVKRLTARVEHARNDMRKRGDKALARARKQAENLTADVEKRIKGVVTPLTERMDVATRGDVERLRKRLEHLERRVEAHGHGATA